MRSPIQAGRKRNEAEEVEDEDAEKGGKRGELTEKDGGQKHVCALRQSFVSNFPFSSFAWERKQRQRPAILLEKFENSLSHLW